MRHQLRPLQPTTGRRIAARSLTTAFMHRALPSESHRYAQRAQSFSGPSDQGLLHAHLSTSDRSAVDLAEARRRLRAYTLEAEEASIGPARPAPWVSGNDNSFLIWHLPRPFPGSPSCRARGAVVRWPPIQCQNGPAMAK